MPPVRPILYEDLFGLENGFLATEQAVESQQTIYQATVDCSIMQSSRKVEVGRQNESKFNFNRTNHD
jgi:formate dehydrogenase assembly factor FdhD